MLDKRANLLAKAIQKKIENDFEFWRFDDALNLLKYVLDPQLVGQAKQIKQYRDWIAHRNPKKPPKTNVSPEAAYRVLSTIVSQLSTNAN